jgi:AcrR family transcriptional regulator
MPDSYHHGALPAALLQVAETILERDGPDGLTLRSAARAAGVSHTAPAHHFGDLSGLLSELAAVGFLRLADQLDAAARTASKGSRLKAIGKSYVHFARARPNLFLLMFRSRRLDRKRASLQRASEAAFAVLRGTIEPEPQEEARASLQSHAKSIAAWSLVHGFAMLMIDDRLPTKWRIDDLLHAVLSSGY